VNALTLHDCDRLRDFPLKNFTLIAGPSGCQNNDCHYGHEYGMSSSLYQIHCRPPLLPLHSSHVKCPCKTRTNKPELDDDQCQELSVLAKQIPCPFARNKKCHYDDESCTYGYVHFFDHHFPGDLQKEESY